MAWLNPEQALGLPAGSVRAIVYWATTFTICFMAVKGMDIDPILAGSWGVITGFYFGEKKGSGLGG